jgi:putative ABC transport system permease protein
MRAGGTLLLRGMRWRLGISLLTVLTCAVAVGAAVLGPLYLWTAGDSVVRTTLTSASVNARGATLAAPHGQPVALSDLQRAERVVEQTGGPHHWYGSPITTVISGVGLVANRSPLRSQLFSRTDICGVLHFQSGGCVLGRGDVVISARSARELGASLGGVLSAATNGASKPLRLKITGIYAVPNLQLPYWWGEGASYFPFGQTTGPEHIPEIDPLISSAATALAVPVQEVPALFGQVPLRADGVGLGNQGALQRGLAHATASAGSRGVIVTTELGSLLANAGHQRHLMSTIVAIAAVQLVLLAIWVLSSLLVRGADARQPEIRVARLRGFPASSLVVATAAEPAILCLVGGVLGIAAAFVAVVVARGQVLDPAATIAPDKWVFAALALTIGAIVATLGLGTFRVMRSSQLGYRAMAAPTGPRATVIADIVLLVLSVVALVALGTSGALAGHSDPIASAAPGLIALGTAVLAVQFALFICRLGVAASSNSERIAAFLAVRQIVRRPGVLRQARVLIIALSLACFATSAWAVARSNRQTEARFTVGSTVVATVIPHGVGLEQAVARLDPRGRFAMAAVTMTTASSTVLAVDAHRLAAALTWPPGISRSTIAATSRALDPPTAPEVTVSGALIRVSATVAATGQVADRLNALDLGLWVFNSQRGTTIVSLGPLHRGTSRYGGLIASVCPGGCRLTGVGVLPAVGSQAPRTGMLRLGLGQMSTRSASGAVTAVALDHAVSDWRSTATGVSITAGGSGGLTLVIPASVTDSYTSEVGAVIPPMASVADDPQVLPGAVTTELESINPGSQSGGSVPIQGLDGATLSITAATTASTLPRVGSDAAMLDLGVLSRAQVDPTSPDATDEVWLGPSAPANVLARMRSVGLAVDSVERASTVFTRLEGSGPALADDFMLVATIIALLAAAASTLGALGATTRQRATELTALEVGGIRRWVLARSLALESVILAATALFGTVAGVIGAIMAVPALPELANPSPIPLHYGLPGMLVAIVTVAVLATVFVATGVIAVILIRRMSPLLLRTAPNDAAA